MLQLPDDADLRGGGVFLLAGQRVLGDFDAFRTNDGKG